MGTTRLSNKLFNQGLERLKVSDFYHGIEMLSKSIAINKNNVSARNLLGLALFEVGHIGDALKHWVISTSLLKDENPASKYIDQAHKNPRILERYNDAVGMFNQALGHIKQKSDDLAIIQLKKAVEINPRFIDALNLLTLCFLIQNDREKALTTVERVLAIDPLNPIGLNYYGLLNPGKTKTRKPFAGVAPAKPLSDAVPYRTISLEEKKQSNFHIAEILAFIIGAACSAAALYFMLIPAIERDNTAQLQTVRSEMDVAATGYQTELDEANAREELLHAQVTQNETEILRLENITELQDRQIRVHHAYNRFLDGELREATSIVDGLMTTGFPNDLLDRIDEIRTGAYPVLGVEYYGEGLAAFNADDFALAAQHLQRAYYFLDEGAAQWNELLFMLASMHYNQGEDHFDEAQVLLLDLQARVPNFRAAAIARMLESIESQI